MSTGPLLADTDGGGAPDGAEDRDVNGRVDTGETDPGNPADDPACPATAPAEIENLLVDRDGDDIVLTSTESGGTGDASHHQSTP